MAHTITRIPEPYRAGFAKIRTLPSHTVKAFREAIDALPPTGGSLRAMVSSLSVKLPNLSSDDIDAVLKTLHSLYVFRATAPDLSIEDTVTSIVGAMQTSGKEALALSEKDKPEYREKLTLLLESKVLETSSKVDQLKTDYATIFYDAKIITDIRPIFSDPSQRPAAATITHTLKVICHEGGEHKELYFALDAEDLRTLRRVIDRAESKEGSIKEFLKHAQLEELS